MIDSRFNRARFSRTAADSMKWAALIALALLSGCSKKPSTHVAPAKPTTNILLISIDTLRADHLGCYGYFRNTSPVIDAFSRECVFFERLIVPMATTLPTHVSMLTGLYPIEHGILANIRHGGNRFKPSPNLQSFTQVAKALGYQTAGFISGTPLKRGSGVEIGFDTYTQPNSASRVAEKTNEDVLSWLREHHAEPFFMFIHYFDPHDPYEPPAPFDEMFKTDEALEKYIAERKISETAQRVAERNKKRGAVVHARQATNQYDGEIRYTDEQIGKLFDTLRSHGVWDKTAIILIGDHGEGLNQHAEPGHGLVWDEQLHAPLMIRVPGVAPQRVPDVVSAADLMPTLLGLLPLPNTQSFAAQFSGRDVLADHKEPHRIFSLTSERQQKFGVPQLFALTDREWKYVCSPDGSQQLYHLKTDPFELTDVTAQHPEVASKLCAELNRLGEAQRQRSKAYQVGISEMTDAEAKQLKDLGYVGDDDESVDAEDSDHEGSMPESERRELEALGYTGVEIEDIQTFCPCDTPTPKPENTPTAP